MKKTYRRSLVLPAAVALSGHALVLFGFPSTHSSERGPFSKPPVTQLAPLPTPVVDLRVDEELDTSDVAPQPAQAQAVNVPQSDDVIGTAPSPFPMELTTVTHLDVLSDVRTLPSGLTGVPSGPSTSSGPSVLDARFLDNAPQARSQMPPVYPHEMRRDGVGGTVVVDFVVARDGRVHSVTVVSSTGRAFEEAAVRAVERWRFAPGLKQGVPVPFRMRVPVSFSLTDT